MHNAAQDCSVFLEWRRMHPQREPIPLREMLWFIDEREDPSQRTGLHCHQENGAYVVTVVDPDGSETRTTFDDEDSMTAEAVRIHLGLERRGWRALPRTE